MPEQVERRLGFLPSLPLTGWMHEEWAGWGPGPCLGSGECKWHAGWLSFGKGILGTDPGDRQEGNSRPFRGYKPRSSDRSPLE